MRTFLYVLLALNGLLALWSWSNDRSTRDHAQSARVEMLGLPQLRLSSPIAGVESSAGNGTIERQQDKPDDIAISMNAPEHIDPQGIVPGIEDALVDVVVTADRVTSQASDPVPDNEFCVRIGPIEGQLRAAEVFALVESRMRAPLLSTASEAREPVFWVHVPVQDSVEDAQAIVDRLTARGLESFIIDEPEALHNAVSLGVFRKRDRAEQLLMELAGLGFELGIYEKAATAPEFLVDGRIKMSPDTNVEDLRADWAETLGDTPVEFTDCMIAR